MVVGVDSVVVLKLPGVLMTKPDGASVIVLVDVWKPEAVIVTITELVLSRAWMKMVGLAVLPAVTCTVSCPVRRRRGAAGQPKLVRVGAGQGHRGPAGGRRRRQDDLTRHLKVLADGLRRS